MPELPEVETIVRGLKPLLCGRSIVDVHIGPKKLRRGWSAAWHEKLRKRRIADVRRRGKWIILELQKEGCLLIHLGMTGQLRVVRRDEEVETHTHARFHLTRGKEELRFRDVRRFGSLDYLPLALLEDFFVSKRFGPEPFALTATDFFSRLRKMRRCLKAALLDQQVVAGVGNIYADESLFEARLHPGRASNRITKKEAERLRLAIVKVLLRAIERKGSSIRNYVDGNGEPGGYQREFRVYQQTGKPCPRCRSPIVQIRLAGRSTHFCERCQRPEQVVQKDIS